MAARDTSPASVDIADTDPLQFARRPLSNRASASSLHEYGAVGEPSGMLEQAVKKVPAQLPRPSCCGTCTL